MMFCCGFNPKHSQKLAEFVQQKKRVNWSEIEAQIYSERFKLEELKKGFLLYLARTPKAVVSLSGPLVSLTTKKVVSILIDVMLQDKPVFSFIDLRTALWNLTNEKIEGYDQEKLWLDVEFTFVPSPGGGPDFKAELRVLDQKMVPYPTSF